MKRETAYQHALDSEGKIVSISEALKGKNYRCVECGQEFILREGPERQKHFAHKKDTGCAGGSETFLHSEFKKRLTTLLNSRIKEKGELGVSWECRECGAKWGPKNLMNRVASVKEEYSMPGCRPDIALLDLNKKVIGVIELVNTHAPEAGVLSFYDNENITLIQINLSNLKDLDRIEEKIMNPDIVSCCLKLKCGKSPKQDSKISYECEKCYNPYDVKTVKINTVFGYEFYIKRDEKICPNCRQKIRKPNFRPIISKVDIDFAEKLFRSLSTDKSSYKRTYKKKKPAGRRRKG